MTDTNPRRALTADRNVIDQMPLAPASARSVFVPENTGQALEFAKVMASGKFSLPKHLQDNPGDCLWIISIAMATGLNPWQLAKQTYSVNNTTLEFQAQAVHAITMASGLIEGGLDLDFAGEGEALTCTVTGRRKGGPPRTHVYRLATITTKNSPLWTQQPQQQLGYYAQRAWCRLHCPEAIMGLTATGEAESMIDITPATAEPAPVSALEAVQAHLNGAAEVKGQEEPAAVSEPEPDALDELINAPAPATGTPGPLSLDEVDKLSKDAEAAADQGMDAYKDFWGELDDRRRTELLTSNKTLKERADEADRERAHR